ncbi:MAG TPA: hypothetical protein PL078_06115 [Bacillota bacterium]|nr:hypothetical protein [Peptococcaceae bacterium MAG4]HPZ43564.1 hypothetical protein [Bacillota bacterium]HQD75964.1 hypothetical protein [Bacillota bacterium]HUM58293.1 hypothetical protein [Bacillota bacterium]
MRLEQDVARQAPAGPGWPPFTRSLRSGYGPAVADNRLSRRGQARAETQADDSMAAMPEVAHRGGSGPGPKRFTNVSLVVGLSPVICIFIYKQSKRSSII